MITYDIWKVNFRGKIADYDGMPGSRYDMLDYVSEHGDWDNMYSSESKTDAFRIWKGTWSEKAVLETDVYNEEVFIAVFYRFERTERDENGEIINSADIDDGSFAMKDITVKENLQ